MNLPANASSFNEMYHALNMNLSSKNFEEGHISTGTIFFDTESENGIYVFLLPAILCLLRVMIHIIKD